MSAPRLPRSENYWKKRGKISMITNHGKITYKNVMLYFHDDFDGIMSCQLIKKYLINKGFNIIGYGVVNYQEGWAYTTIDNSVINIAVDFSTFNKQLDCYVDHHFGDLSEAKNDFAIKTSTGSAFEGIALQYGMAVDALNLHPIDMIDSAKYKHYGVDITKVIKFNWKTILKSEKKKLTFIAMINQFIKRSDYTTLIEVAYNCNEPSPIAIYLKFKEFYAGNNIWNDGRRKDFVEDGLWRINTMINKTRGYGVKKCYNTQDEFINDFWDGTRINLAGKGYQILGCMAFIPSGSWANGIRARAILEEDMRCGIIKKDSIDFILLQFGNTLQMVAYDNIKTIESPPILKDGTIVTNIGDYMNNLLNNFKTHLNYSDPSTYISTIEDDVTVAGGHGSIGSISNICSKVFNGVFKDMKYLDVFKNKIIQDISKCEWKNLKINWSSDTDRDFVEPIMNSKVIMVENIRTSGKQKTLKEK